MALDRRMVAGNGGRVCTQDEVLQVGAASQRQLLSWQAAVFNIEKLQVGKHCL